LASAITPGRQWSSTSQCSAANWTLSTFADFQASDDPAEQDKIMRGMLVTEGGGDHYCGSIKMPVDGALCG
jgi:hypothetical protein